MRSLVFVFSPSRLLSHSRSVSAAHNTSVHTASTTSPTHPVQAQEPHLVTLTGQSPPESPPGDRPPSPDFVLVGVAPGQDNRPREAVVLRNRVRHVPQPPPKPPRPSWIRNDFIGQDYSVSELINSEEFIRQENPEVPVAKGKLNLYHEIFKVKQHIRKYIAKPVAKNLTPHINHNPFRQYPNRDNLRRKKNRRRFRVLKIKEGRK